MNDQNELADAKLLFEDNRGIYIPQNFAQEIRRECIEGVSGDTFKILEAGPDHEWYWEAWDEVLNNAVVTELDTGVRYYIIQDGDVFLFPIASVHAEEN